MIGKRRCRSGIVLFLVALLSITIVAAPPTPHNVQGFILNIGGSGMPNGIPIIIINTVTGQEFETQVFAPPVQPGAYSATVNGSDGDLIIVRAWNGTDFAENNITLASTTTYINASVNTTRASETNVTIFTPINHSVYNTTNTFNVTANITIIGGANGENCSATLTITNTSIADIVSGSYTKDLGDITLGNTVNVSWEIEGLNIGTVNFTVNTSCDSDDIIFDRLTNDTVMNISIEDTTPPNITLIDPLNNTFVYNQTVYFVYIANDTHSSIQNCTLTVDGVVVEDNASVTEEIQMNFSEVLGFGEHNYSISCRDTYNNTATSDLYFFNVTDKDLMINSTLIVLSNYNPVETNKVIINATVVNIGTENVAESFIVQFWDHDNYGSRQIGENQTISSLNAGENASVNVTWNASVGNHSLEVRVDTPMFNGSIFESNETNNNDSVNIFISQYQTTYGNFSGGFILASSTLSTVMNFTLTAESQANIYLTETGLSISFLDLEAIGRDTSKSPTADDFEEIDVELNTTPLDDSINRTWTSGGSPIGTKIFYVFEQAIANVPVVNSTNTSDFVTGILWDKDDGHTEYNGTQDLVFVTETNYQKHGKYGFYDYEIRIPANLRDYKESGSNTVIFYHEIR